jgi:hypothetical protein
MQPTLAPSDCRTSAAGRRAATAMQGVSEPNRATALDRRGPSVAPGVDGGGGRSLPARCTPPLSSAPNGPPSVSSTPNEINARGRQRSDASWCGLSSWRVEALPKPVPKQRATQSEQALVLVEPRGSVRASRHLRARLAARAQRASGPLREAICGEPPMPFVFREHGSQGPTRLQDIVPDDMPRFPNDTGHE